MKRNHRLLTTILTTLAIAGCTTPKAPTVPDNIKQGDYSYVKEYMRWYIKEEMEKSDIVGLSIALVDDQKIVWQEGFGYADKKKNLKATPKTRYWAGSITKLFTGMGVMKQVEEGKMDIDKPLKTYLPEFSIKSRFGSTDGITPRTIMTHHSGLPGDWLDGMFSKNPIPYTEHVKLIKNEYVSYAPNTIMSYSNLGVSMVGHALEKTVQQPYASYIDAVLLKPLEMKNSDFKMDINVAFTSKSYSEGDETTEYPIGEIPAGALGTTVGDLSHLAMMVSANGKYKGKEVLKTETLKKMFTVQNRDVALDLDNKMGLSWFIDDVTLGKKNLIYGHGGATTAHRAHFAVAPKKKLGVVVLCNSAEADASKIANELMKKAWEAKTGHKVQKPAQVAVHKNANFEGTYASMLGKTTIKKVSETKYVGTSANVDFSLKADEQGIYRAKYLLWNFIPLGDDELNKLSFYSKTIEGKKLIVGNINGTKFIAGVKVESKPIPKAWKNYVGTYKIVNQLEPEDFQIKQVKVKTEDRFTVLEIEMMTGEKMVEILDVVNEHEAIIEGLGRSKRETIYLKDGIFHYSGLKFKKEE